MAITDNIGDYLQNLANTCRTNGYFTGAVNAQDIPSKLPKNQGAKTATLNATTTSYTIPAGYHNGSGKVSVATASHASPSISWSGATATASHTQTIGSVATGTATTTATSTITTQAAKTVTPSNSEQTIFASGSRVYCSGAVKVAAVSTDIYSLLDSEVFALGTHLSNSSNAVYMLTGYNTSRYGAPVSVSRAYAADATAHPGIVIPIYQTGTYDVEVIMRGTLNGYLILDLNSASLYKSGSQSTVLEARITVSVSSASVSVPAYIAIRNNAASDSTYKYVFAVRMRKK